MEECDVEEESFVNVRSVSDILLSLLEKTEGLDHGSDEPFDFGIRVAIVVDSEGRLLYMSPAFGELVGVDPEESVGMRYPFSWCAKGRSERCGERFGFLRSEEAREMGIDSISFDLGRACKECLEIPARNQKLLDEGRSALSNAVCLAVSDPADIRRIGVPEQTRKEDGFRNTRRSEELEATWRRIGIEFERLGVSTGILRTPVQPSACPGLSSLSRREWEIVNLFMEGSRVPNIASTLCISPHTVRNHLQSIYRKLDVRSQAELIEKLRGPARRNSGLGEFPRTAVNA
jgi:DNA-binding CsgD family transcriptional regulator